MVGSGVWKLQCYGVPFYFYSLFMNIHDSVFGFSLEVLSINEYIFWEMTLSHGIYIFFILLPFSCPSGGTCPKDFSDPILYQDICIQYALS